MAIKSVDTLSNKNNTKFLCPTNISNGSSVSQLMNLNITATQLSTTGTSKCNKLMKTNSPYLAGDKGLFSRVIEKRFLHKQGTDFVSSFPLAAQIYKANSDEFRLTKQTNKAAKKSVLTLPIERLVRPETCTVSDMNDSEYFNQENKDHKRKTRRKLSSQNNRKPHVRNKDEFKFYDRDARYCSQMNVHLDCSSSDIVKEFKGDGKRHRKTSHFAKSPRTERNVNPHDVWTVLRNINRFQFRPSPPISEDNVSSPKNNRPLKKKWKHRKDTRVIETCRTEEFAYISNFEVASKSPTDFSRSSSIDRVTVINKDAEFTEICHEFEKRVSNTQKFIKGATYTKAGNRIKNTSTKYKKPVENNSTIKEMGVSSDLNQLVLLNQTDSNALNIKTDIEGCKEIIKNRLEASCYAKSGTSLNESIKKHNSDQLSVSIKVRDRIQGNCKINKVNPYGDCNETIYSVCSGSSKAGLQTFVRKNTNKKIADKDKLLKVSPEESSQDIKGISKVVFNKSPDMMPPKRDISNRKPWLVRTAPSAAVTPKLTQTETRRRLANLKFPLVILGKDQLTSAPLRVEPFDAFQFSGLDKQVWPFMENWYDNKGYSDCENVPTNENKDQNRRMIAESNKNHGDSISINVTKQGITKITKSHNNYNLKTLKENIANNDRQYWQDKNFKQFKDKVLQLIYKKSSTGTFHDDDNVDEKDDTKKQKHIIEPKNVELLTHASKKDASTETYKKFCQHPDILKSRSDLNSPSLRSRKIPTAKHPWSKVKWVSDFIDNVIKKIKSGIYYNEENRIVGKKQYPAWREASIQTNLSMGIKSFDDYIGQDSESSPKVIVDNKKYHLKMIPGFDEALQAVEIKTMDVKQIAVKHCLTNIIVEFDVAIPTELKCTTMNPQETSSLVPIPLANSQTKIFKCKTILLNPILPAELCCLLPKMIQSVTKSNISKHLALSPILAKKNEYELSPISKLLPSRHSDIFVFQLISHIAISRDSIALPEGTFPITIKNKPTVKKRALLIKYSRLDILCNILGSKIDVVPFMSSCSAKPDSTVIIPKQKYNVLPEQKPQNCTAIQAYMASKKSLIPTVIANTYMNILQKIWRNEIINHFNFSSCPENDIQITVFNNSCKIDNTATQKVISLSVGNLTINSRFYDFMNPNHTMISKLSENKEVSSLKSRRIENVKPSKTEKSSFQNLSSNNNKNKKNAFVRLYKKCKSTTSISGERTSTSLNKINTIEDFCQALGSGKLLSSVFEGYAEKKILMALVQMKNWIMEISQRQAMLILLLTNKKDTPNLVRFRPVLLQGIAVNRITRASELDMEIEVIERENVNKRPQYEGISYVTSTDQTKNNLLEELYWIAKTTASDYQKPFDESSERLLKSLLEKRKKLNPSYLRVMARYVGLGLLKPPNKFN